MMKTHMSLRRRLLKTMMWIAGTPVLALIVFCTLNYTGLCVNQWRYLSHEEKILKVADYIIYKPNAVYVFQKDKIERKDLSKQHRYQNAKEFLMKNPNCCEITTGHHTDTMSPIPIISRAFGFYNYNVKLTYQDYVPNASDDVLLKHVDDVVKINNCGRVFR